MAKNPQDIPSAKSLLDQAFLSEKKKEIAK